MSEAGGRASPPPAGGSPERGGAAAAGRRFPSRAPSRLGPPAVAPGIESILVVTKRTPLNELEERFNSRAQARFYIEHAGLSFAEYEAAHEAYVRAVDALRVQLPRGIKTQVVERSFLPSFKFSGRDLVVTIGPDGLVINVAKYLTREPILALNPDPSRVDGILIPFSVPEARRWIDRALAGAAAVQPVSMAKAELNDGQELHAVNDLFIGVRSHVSARYRLRFGGRLEDQSSSGVIVSTGAGSTGWLSSILNGVEGISRAGTVEAASRERDLSRGPGREYGAERRPSARAALAAAIRSGFAPGAGSRAPRAGSPMPDAPGMRPVSPPRPGAAPERAGALEAAHHPRIRLPWDSDNLIFAVREPFASKTSRTDVVFGTMAPRQSLVIESQMPENGVIFSDGIEADCLQFNSGSVATIRLADRKAHLIVRG